MLLQLLMAVVSFDVAVPGTAKEIHAVAAVLMKTGCPTAVQYLHGLCTVVSAVCRPWMLIVGSTGLPIRLSWWSDKQCMIVMIAHGTEQRRCPAPIGFTASQLTHMQRFAGIPQVAAEEIAELPARTANTNLSCAASATGFGCTRQAPAAPGLLNLPPAVQGRAGNHGNMISVTILFQQ